MSPFIIYLVYIFSISSFIKKHLLLPGIFLGTGNKVVNNLAETDPQGAYILHKQRK